jgi:hypothetical protein
VGGAGGHPQHAHASMIMRLVAGQLGQERPVMLSLVLSILKDKLEKH